MYVNSDNFNYTGSDLEVMKLLRDNIEHLLYENNVNLAFWGHNHQVQRQSAVLNETVIQSAEMINGVAVQNNPQATVHLVVGTAGANIVYNNVFPPPDWNELVFHEWGYARVTVSSPTQLLYEWVNNTNGEVLDTMTISQAYPIQQWSTSSTTPTKSTSHLIRNAVIAVVCLVVVAFIVVGYFYYRHKYHTADDMNKQLNPNNRIEIEERRKVDVEQQHTLNPISHRID